MRLKDSERGRDLGFEARSEGAPSSRSNVLLAVMKWGRCLLLCEFVLIECGRYRGLEARR